MHVCSLVYVHSFYIDQIHTYQTEICTEMDAAEGGMTRLINNARYR